MLSLAESHALAKGGDPSAMSDVVTLFARFVAGRARNPPPLLDADDAESLARESVWIAAARCDVPHAIASYARTAYRFLVLSHQRREGKRLRVKHLNSWANVPACGVRFPAALLHRTPDPCLECGTPGGRVQPGRTRPDRIKGLCAGCDMNARNATRRNEARTSQTR